MRNIVYTKTHTTEIRMEMNDSLTHQHSWSCITSELFRMRQQLNEKKDTMKQTTKLRSVAAAQTCVCVERTIASSIYYYMSIVRWGLHIS